MKPETDERKARKPAFSAGSLVAARYQLRDRLGVSVASETWSGVDVATGKSVAVKLSTGAGVDRLPSAMSTVADIQHENVVQIFDVGMTDDGVVFLVTELLRGETLASLLERKERLSPRESASIAHDVARALQAVHARGIFHGTLAPSNIFLHVEEHGHSPVIKLLNTGTFSAVAGSNRSPLFGILQNMSPEQLRRAPTLDERTDIWSLGVALYRMLAGKYLFVGDPLEIVVQIAQGDIPLAKLHASGIDPDLLRIIEGCLTHDPAKRLGPAAEVAAQLKKHALDDRPIPLPAPERTPEDKPTAHPAAPEQHASCSRRVFIACSDEDLDLREQLEAHLSLLKREGLIDVWHNGHVLSGEPWEVVVRRQLEDAWIILLLITKDFLASDFCYTVEFNVALRRHQTGAAKLMPIMARPCDSHIESLISAPMLPPGGKPIVSWSDPDAAWAAIVAELRAALKASSRGPRRSLGGGLSWWPLSATLVFLVLTILVAVALAMPLVGAFQGMTILPSGMSSMLPVQGALVLIPIAAVLRRFFSLPIGSLSNRPREVAPRAQHGRRLGSDWVCFFCGWAASPEHAIILRKQESMFSALYRSLPRCRWCAELHTLVELTCSRFKWTSFACATSFFFCFAAYDLSPGSTGIVLLAPALGALSTALFTRVLKSILLRRHTPSGTRLYTDAPAALASRTWGPVYADL